MVEVQEHLQEVGDELRVKLAGQLFSHDLFKDMLNVKFIPKFGLGDALMGDYHKMLEPHHRGSIL